MTYEKSFDGKPNAGKSCEVVMCIEGHKHDDVFSPCYFCGCYWPDAKRID